MNEHAIEPVTVTIPDALRLSGIGRTTLYHLLAKREIASIHVGRRRLIKVDSLKAFLASREV